ncbi:MAG: hypothetical protein M1812_002126 [Candelaria pacifica]|nr:MAG: hypothetical protein M1812_002126 [Candelaria pacifica]
MKLEHLTPLALLASSFVGLATAETAETYAIYPKDGRKTDQTKAILDKLTKTCTKGHVDTSSAVAFGVNFWTCDLLKQQADSLGKENNVASVSPVCKKNCFDPSTSPIPNEELESPFISEEEQGPDSLVSLEPRKKDKAIDDLIFISQQPGKRLQDMSGEYKYDNAAGSGIKVYIVDTGAYLDKPDFQIGENVASRATWLKVGQVEPNDDSSMSLDRSGGKGHGTCMLSHVCGFSFGVAKKASPIIVRVPRGATIENYLEGISKVHDDIVNTKNPHKGTQDHYKSKSVILMPWFYPTGQVNAGWIARAKTLLDDLIDNYGVLPVTGTGNNGEQKVDGYPAGYAKGTDNLKHMLAVGAVTNAGDAWPGTNAEGNLPNVWAPGVDVQCASAFSFENSKRSSGTSPASAKTAGLAAYLWSLDANKNKSPEDISTLVQHLAYSRIPSQRFKAVYNGYTGN